MPATPGYGYTPAATTPGYGFSSHTPANMPATPGGGTTPYTDDRDETGGGDTIFRAGIMVSITNGKWQ
jgi:hypothetical protein